MTPSSPEPGAVEGDRPWESWEPTVAVKPGICSGVRGRVGSGGRGRRRGAKDEGSFTG